MNISPLRYPGSKYAFRNKMIKVIEFKNLIDCDFYEPFCGGASLSLYLLEKEIIKKAILIEKDALIYSFWKTCIEEPEYLFKRIDSVNVNLSTWEEEKTFLKLPYSKSLQREMAFACLFLNRTCFSGILKAGPLGGYNQLSEYKIDCRFNKNDLINRIRFVHSHAKEIKIYHGDGINYLTKNNDRISTKNSLVYLDPPYYKNGHRLYNEFFSETDHFRLCDVLAKAKYKWLLSYDYSNEILDLYKTYPIIPIEFNYSIRKTRNADELLISNFASDTFEEYIPDKEFDKSYYFA